MMKYPIVHCGFALLTVTGLVGVVHAAPVVNESFEYGSTTDQIQNVSTFAASSSVLLYVHDAGLDHPLVVGETAGSLTEETDDKGGRQAARSDISYSYGNLAEDDVFWFSALIQYNNTDVTGITFNGDNQVTPVGFGTDASGNLVLRYWDSGPNEAVTDDTGLDLIPDGTTYLVVMRGTKGDPSVSYGPQDSIIDIWLDPTLQDLAGAGDYTSNNSKWARSSTNLNGLIIDVGIRNHVDEIRAGEDLADLNLIPEPTCAAALLLASGLMCRRRWGA